MRPKWERINRVHQAAPDSNCIKTLCGLDPHISSIYMVNKLSEITPEDTELYQWVPCKACLAKLEDYKKYLEQPIGCTPEQAERLRNKLF